MNKIDLKHLAPYDSDYALWAVEQAALLRAGRLDRLDRDNLAEEIDDLARSQESEIESRLDVLLMHLLKWQFQPEARSRNWRGSISEQRRRIHRKIKLSPSLRNVPGEVLCGRST